MGAFIPLPVRVPLWIQWLYPRYIWHLPAKEKVVYLTFDDGPIPEVTPWVLDLLDTYDAQATFFCIGENVLKHPELFQSLEERGHAVGNHTQHHLHGWKSTVQEYVKDVQDADRAFAKALQQGAPNTPQENNSEGSYRLFRPPYGKIKRKQARALENLGYRIIMYEVIAKDWDARLNGYQCTANVLKHVRPGSLVVFHDSIKAQKNLRDCLPQILSAMQKQGYRFKRIPVLSQ
ncbi:polysaccharide deacetylase family protein [Croceiramulus getboli]|nr:polysaccharide deacetylase family protein [Flavobacteriaceae bacterium YJPT1-3]